MRAERERRESILQAEGTKQSQILVAEGEKQSAILRADAAKQAAILQAEGAKQAKILEAEAQAEAIMKVQQATGSGGLYRRCQRQGHQDHCPQRDPGPGRPGRRGQDGLRHRGPQGHHHQDGAQAVLTIVPQILSQPNGPAPSGRPVSILQSLC